MPLIVKWPGTIQPGSKTAEIISHEDWMPTFAAAAGMPGVVEKFKEGHTANGKEWRVHLDGHDFGPYFRGESEKGPRDTVIYFGAGGDLNAVRWNDFKAHFATQEGPINKAIRYVPAWPFVVNARWLTVSSL